MPKDANGDIDYRAFFARFGIGMATVDHACAMARERLNRQIGQRVRRELERLHRMRRENENVVPQRWQSVLR